jgi:hypothetical protein
VPIRCSAVRCNAPRAGAAQLARARRADRARAAAEPGLRGLQGRRLRHLRSRGAVTMRGRNEPPEIVQVTLPEWSSPEGEPTSSVTLRIPEQGAFPQPGHACRAAFSSSPSSRRPAGFGRSARDRLPGPAARYSARAAPADPPHEPPGDCSGSGSSGLYRRLGVVALDRPRLNVVTETWSSA